MASRSFAIGWKTEAQIAVALEEARIVDSVRSPVPNYQNIRGTITGSRINLPERAAVRLGCRVDVGFLRYGSKRHELEALFGITL